MASVSEELFPPSIHSMTSGADILSCISTAHAGASFDWADAIIAMTAAVVASGSLPVFFCFVALITSLVCLFCMNLSMLAIFLSAPRIKVRLQKVILVFIRYHAPPRNCHMSLQYSWTGTLPMSIPAFAETHSATSPA